MGLGRYLAVARSLICSSYLSAGKCCAPLSYVVHPPCIHGMMVHLLIGGHRGEAKRRQAAGKTTPDSYDLLDKLFTQLLDGMGGKDGLRAALIAEGKDPGSELEMRAIAMSAAAAGLLEMVDEIGVTRQTVFKWWAWKGEADPDFRLWLDTREAERDAVGKTKH